MQKIKMSVSLASFLMIGCGMVSEADEFKRLATTNVPELVAILKGAEINYFQYAAEGKIDRETAIAKTKDQLVSCAAAEKYIRNVPAFTKQANSEVWRFITSANDAECKKLGAILTLVESRDVVEKNEARKNAEKYRDLSVALMEKYKASFMAECKKHECVKYLKVQ